MNPLKAIGRVVTAPVRFVKQTRQVLRARDRAVDVIEHLEAAAADARLYRSATWWGELAELGLELLVILPIAPEVTVKAQGFFLKAVMVLGSIGGLAGAAVEKGWLDVLPPKYGAPIGLVLGGIATVAAYLHKSPLTAQMLEAAAAAPAEPAAAAK